MGLSLASPPGPTSGGVLASGGLSGHYTLTGIVVPHSGQSVLVPFAKDIAGVLHGADPNHLVTLGTQANGAPGASGTDFLAIYQQDGLDFTEVHDWNRYGSDTEPLPGSRDGQLPPTDAGASGYLVWHVDRAATDNLDVIPGQQDPLFAIMSRQRDALGNQPG